MIAIPEIMYLGDRVLLYGMDPTKTLCEICREIISPDYMVVNVYADLGRLTHARCIPNMYERELLGHGETNGPG